MKVFGEVLRFVFLTVPGVVLGAAVCIVYFGPFMLLDACLLWDERKRTAATKEGATS